MKVFDLIIIGCGGMGSAAFYSATNTGLKTLCIEQYTRNHNKGGTHGETRAFRKAYYDDSNYIPILQQAYDDWKQINRKIEEKIFVENGALEIGAPKSSMVLEALSSADKYHIPIEILSNDKLNLRFPDFYIPKEMVGIFQPEAGFLYVDKCVNYFIDTAVSNGGSVSFNEKVEYWYVDANQTIYVKTDKETYRSKFLIITTGSWSSQLLSDLKLPLTIVQKKLLWLKTINNSYLIENDSPCFAYHIGNEIFYGFPSISGHIKIARHTGGLLLSHPDKSPKFDNDEEFNSLRKFADQYLTGISLENIKQDNCLYDNTPDKQFILDTHPTYHQVAFVTGLSGHGYKMCNVIGEILVDLVTKKYSKFDISFLSLKRFASNSCTI